MSKERSRWATTTADARPVMIVVALALLIGFIASRFVDPVYVARATLWVEKKGNAPDQVRSPQVVFRAVRDSWLFIEPSRDADPALFEGFALRERFMPGDYTLTIDGAGRQWELRLPYGPVADTGVVGDSIGRRMGLRWAPTAAALARYKGREQEFRVNMPRDVGVDLRLKITASQPANSRFLSLTLADDDPRYAAHALNAIARQYARMANARGAGPVTVLDSAVTPRVPARNSAAQIIGQTLLVGVGLGLCLILVQAARSAGMLALPDAAPRTENHPVSIP